MMLKAEKALARARAHPNQVSFAEIDLILRNAGYELRKIVGSHHIYKKPGAPLITVPYRRPHIKPVYGRAVLEVVDQGNLGSAYIGEE